jgi:UDP-N-acetylglucosamine:LPS N-acetylglucosamine transferase
MTDKSKKLLLGSVPVVLGGMGTMVALVGAAALVELAIPIAIIGSVAVTGLIVSHRVTSVLSNKEDK